MIAGTPEPVAIDKDIKELLKPFITDTYLEEIDFFLGDNDAFRKAIKEFGCGLQKEQNEKQYNILAKGYNNDNLSSQVKDPNRYIRFLDRFSCPFRRTAIQDFLHLSLELDKEEGINILLQLKKFGGSKGHGKQLVAAVIQVLLPQCHEVDAKLAEGSCAQW